MRKCTPMPAKKQQAESHAKMCTHKSSQTRHKHRNGQRHSTQNQKTQYTEPKDTVIAKGTDTWSLALKQATEWHMGVKRAQSHSHARTTKTASKRENIAKRYREMAQKRGWAHKIDTGATKYRNCSN